MLLDLSEPAYGKSAAVQPVPMPMIATPGPPPVPMPTYSAPMAATDLLESRSMYWDWQQLRDYVLRSIEERHGPQPPRDPAKVASVFKAFAARWGNQAGPIARFAFEQQGGYWRSGPVGLERFTKGADAYFAGPISERLAHV